MHLREFHYTDLDPTLLLSVLALVGLGLVMVGSASLPIAADQTGNPFAMLGKQTMHLLLGLILGWMVLFLPLRFWERAGPWLLLAGLGLLLLVLVPGLGREVNGSTRWLTVGPLTVQVSELVKLFTVIYLAGFLVRRGGEVRASNWGFLKVLLVLGVVTVLLLLEPDFGTAVVILVTGLGLLFLGGVRLWRFGVLMLPLVAMFAALAWLAPYRLKRLVAFRDPWADAFGDGFQLTQSLIAFGRGEWTGTGLGAGIQKLHYLPEGHTDFLFAVLAEELGLVGSLTVIGLFALLVGRGMVLGRRAELRDMPFAAFLAYGLCLWLGFQAFINLGVNMGLLPTKGLTLPLMSYGGSSLVVTCIAVALLLRVGFEARAVKRNFKF